MKIPDQPTQRIGRDLSYNIRELETLWGAWTSVRRRALASRDEDTLRDAREIDQNPSKAIRNLHEALRKGTFQFASQRGVVKTRKGKTPRPIVVSPVRNRIVQRAILDVLQSRKPSIRKKLGQLPDILATPTSVGGIPGRGSPDAVALIHRSISNGATHFIRSDIRDFFTKVPTRKFLTYLKEQTADCQFVDFLGVGLKVELSNANEPQVREWLSLFPNEHEGVPQGSSLSALCANAILREFDAHLNQHDISMIRYVDDFVILGPSEESVRTAWKAGESILKSIGLEAHAPVKDGTKAPLGDTRNGFDFLSYRFQGVHISPARSTKRELIEKIRTEIRDAKISIQRGGTERRRADSRYIQTLVRIDRRIRGWGDAFKETNQRVQFAQLDAQIFELIQQFQGWFLQHTKAANPAYRMRSLGIALLADTPTADAR